MEPIDDDRRGAVEQEGDDEEQAPQQEEHAPVGIAPRHLAELARKKRKLLVVDEAFMDFVEEESMKSRVRDNPYLIVLRSLTKFYSLPGLRIGYLLGERERIAQLASRQEPWSVNAPALHIARACLADCGFAMKTARWLGREQKFLSARLGAIEGLRVFGAHANFLLVRIDRKGTAAPARTVHEKWGRRLDAQLRTCDAVLISDYGGGVVTPGLVHHVKQVLRGRRGRTRSFWKR